MRRLAAALVAVPALLAGAGSAAGGVPEHPGVSVGPEPSWVESTTGMPQGAEVEPGAAGSALSCLELDYQILLDQGTAREYLRSTYRIETQAGLEDASQYEIDFDPSFSTVVIHSLRVLRDGEWQERLDDAFVTIAQRESDFSWRLYDGSLSILLVLEDVRVGDAVSLAYTVSGTNPVFGDRFFQGISMGWGLPVKWRRVRVLCPRGDPLFWRGHGSVAAEPIISAVGEWDQYLWREDDLPSVELEAWTPDDWDDYPWLQLTQYRSWYEVAKWAVPLYRSAERPSPEVANAARSITTGAKGTDRRVAALIQWVQDEIRYFGVEFGSFSHEPHPPADTIRRRYGDCKDKSLLLIALLKEIGVPAWPVMVDTSMGAALPGRLPSPGLFDHVIVLARIDGRDLWIDPTLSLQGGPLDALWLPDYAWGLVVRESEHDLTRITPEPGGRGAVEATYHYTFGDDGVSCEVAIETTYRGRQAELMRQRSADSTVAELQESYARYYSLGNSRAVPTSDLELDDQRDVNVYRSTERYRLEDWWYQEEGTEYFDLLPLLMGDVVTTSEDPERRAPIQLPKPVPHREQVIISPPTAWDLEPLHESVETPWFSYRIDGSRSGKDLVLAYEFRTTGATVSPDEVATYNSAVDTFNQDLSYSIYRPAPGSGAVGSGTDLTMPPVWVAMSGAVLAGLLIAGALFWMLGRIRFL